jgi:hypothetical protein
MDRMRSPNINRSRRRRHAAARARVAAGVMSVAAFLGLGTTIAVRSATTAAAGQASSLASSTRSQVAPATETPSVGSAVSGGFATGQAPVTTSHGS